MLQQTQGYLSPVTGGISNTATILVARSLYANRCVDTHQQLKAISANAHSSTTHIPSTTVRHSSTSTRAPTPTPLHSVASNSCVARVKTPTLRTNPQAVSFLDEQQQLLGATHAAKGESVDREATQPLQVQFPPGISPIPSRPK